MSAADPISREQRLGAYRSVIKCFIQEEYTVAKEEALANLRTVLAITQAEHLAARAEARAEQLQQQDGASGSAPPAAAEPSAGIRSSQKQQQARAGADARALIPTERSVQLPSPFRAFADGQPLPSSRSGGAGAGVKRPSAHTAASGAAAAAAAYAFAGAAAAAGGGRGGGLVPRKRVRGVEGLPVIAAAGADGAARGLPAATGGRRVGTRQRTPGAAAAVAAGEIDPLVGTRVSRHWPNDGGWFDGIVSDFNPATGEHCIVYDLGTPTESYEWYRIRGAPPQHCKVKNEPANIPTGVLAAVAAAAPAAGSSRRQGAAAAAAAQAGPRPPGQQQQQQLVQQQGGGQAAKPAARQRNGKAAVAAQPGMFAQNTRPQAFVTAGSAPGMRPNMLYASAAAVMAPQQRRHPGQESSDDDDDDSDA